MKILARISAAIAGVLVGGLLVALIETISSIIYPMPEGFDFNNADDLAAWIDQLPLGAFIFVLIAWALGIFMGTFVARRLAPNRSILVGILVWSLFTIATIANLIMIPHPFWFWIAGIAVCLVFGLAGFVMAAPSSYFVGSRQLINAPVEKVFGTLSNVSEFANAVPGIKNIEFLSDQKSGIGTRFRETRVMNGKDATTDLEVTELIENERIRMVSDAGGTIWDTIFLVAKNDDQVEMSMKMEARPYRMAARVMTPFILPMVARFVEQDMQSIKEYCQSTMEAQPRKT